MKFAGILNLLMKLRRPGQLVALCGLIFMSFPAMAQRQEQERDQEPQQLQQQTLPAQKAGSVAKSSAGEVGLRQGRDQPVANIKPMARIDNRIANRVQNRIRSRIDRYYDPLANTNSPFVAATDETKKSASQTQP